MNAFRSILFNIFYMIGSLIISIFLLWALLLPPSLRVAVISTVYGRFISLSARYIMGLKLAVEGTEHLPKDGVYILAAKHQSAFETLQIPFMPVFKYPAIVHKKELRYLPIWGLYLGGMGQISVDRGQGAEALGSMALGCKRTFKMGRPVIIFPQGTRVAPGVKKPYKAGLAKLYRDLNVPIVPVALNSGVFWGRNAFFKKSGTITFKILPPLPPGMPPLKMMEQLEDMLERESARLVKSAGEIAS